MTFTVLKKGLSVIKPLVATVLLVLLLVACDSQQDKQNNTISDDTLDLQISHATASFTLDENRLVITFWDGQNRVADVDAVQVTAREDGEIVWQGMAQNYSDYEIPYWVVYPELTHTGPWVFDIDISRDGKGIQRGALALQVWEEPIGIAAGEAAFPSETRTSPNGESLAAITSDPDPLPALYEVSVAEGLAEHRPMLVIFSTPGLCESKICAPVMNTVKPLYKDYGDQMRFIHVEVYEDFENLSWVEAMREWQLQAEPWIYLINADGIVEARFDGPVARSELEPAVKDLLNGS